MAHPRAKRRLIVAILGLLLAAVFFFSVGHLVVSIDPLERADAIYVLGGSRVNRGIEAAYLYREGYAPRIVFSPGNVEYGEQLLDREGIHTPNEGEFARDVVVGRLGVPAAATTVLAASVDNTAQEVEAIALMADRGGWTRLVVITDCASTRRAKYAFQRILGPRVRIIARCARFDRYNAARWWAARWSFRQTFYEAPKLLAYWLGLRG